MKVFWSLTPIVLILPLAGACSRNTPQPQPQPTSLNRACVVATTADPGSDSDLARLQQDLREHPGAARAAEQIGYRFIARARLSNDPGYYNVAEQAAACLESIRAERARRVVASRSRTASDAPLCRSRGDCAAARGVTRVRSGFRTPRGCADGAGPRGRGRRSVSKDDRPQAFLSVLHARRTSSVAFG